MPTPPTAPYAAPSPRALNNPRGVALMTLGFFAFAAGDATAKLLTDDLHPFQVVWFRQSGLFLGVVLMLAIRGLHILRTPRPGLQISRGLVAAGSASCFIFAIGHVPLADATAVSFVAPFIVTVLGALLLREPVGLRRWLAVAVGFAGMLIVIRPGLGVFHPAILLVVVAASFFALRQILSRALSGTDSIATIVSYTALTSFAAISLAQPLVWHTPSEPRIWLLIACMTGAAAAGEILVIRALDIAQAVVLAPVHYSLILWSTFYGFVVFADLPDGWTLLGCAVIVASGLYTLHRERRAARRQSSAE
ncbi:DMT family transporter [Thalassococcus sp. CAU 1522]|uniref:DMT family transporter n=1 Tax=Thalassococcus arenae TaxID=2851652 RepID=A0ABS6N7J2_9RHOB|nr:DMT family transporter [Thalassococcus arenae]MBV2359976.1 DMT family transporter [Thalassococcus arenae]